MQRTISGPVVGAADDDVPTVVGDADTPDMQEATGLYQSDTGGQDINDGAPSTDTMQNSEVGLNVQPLSPVPSCSEVPAVGRPKRDRRPNVKYRSDEYDLSKVSAAKETLVCMPSSAGLWTGGGVEVCSEGFCTGGGIEMTKSYFQILCI